MSHGRGADRFDLKHVALTMIARALGAPLRVGERGPSIDPRRYHSTHRAPDGAHIGYAAARADAIVVLGAAMRADGRLSSALDERVRAGCSLWHQGAAPVICVTGGGSGQHNEAQAMARRAMALGVPEDALRIEPHARSTAENAQLSAALLGREQRTASIWLVSQPFHLRRARMWFRAAGFAQVHCFSPYPSLQDRHPRKALRWLAREYAALAYAMTRLPTHRRHGTIPKTPYPPHKTEEPT